MDYQAIVTQIGEIVKYCMPMGILIGIIERIMRMVIHAATGKES